MRLHSRVDLDLLNEVRSQHPGMTDDQIIHFAMLELDYSLSIEDLGENAILEPAPFETLKPAKPLRFDPTCKVEGHEAAWDSNVFTYGTEAAAVRAALTHMRDLYLASEKHLL